MVLNLEVICIETWMSTLSGWYSVCTMSFVFFTNKKNLKILYGCGVCYKRRTNEALSWEESMIDGCATFCGRDRFHMRGTCYLSFIFSTCHSQLHYVFLALILTYWMYNKYIVSSTSLCMIMIPMLLSDWSRYFENIKVTFLIWVANSSFFSYHSR